MKEFEIIVEAVKKATLNKMEVYAVNDAISKLELILIELENGKNKDKVTE